MIKHDYKAEWIQVERNERNAGWLLAFVCFELVALAAFAGWWFGF